MRTVTEQDPISLDELGRMATGRFGDLVKTVINLRPSLGNRSRGVDDPATRERITVLVRRLVCR